MGVTKRVPADPSVASSIAARVLVIDENPDHQLLAVTALVHRRFEVKSASTAREGLRLVDGGTFDAVLVDAKVRDPPVLEFLSMLAKRLPDTPRILLVPANGEDLALRGLDAGATAFVVKSPSFRILLPPVVDRQIRDIRVRRHMDDALRESQRVLSTLMSNLPGMAYRCRNDPPVWTVEFVSEGSMALTGYSPEAFEKGTATFGQLVHPDDLDGVTRAVDEAVRDKRPFQMMYRLRTAAGDDKWVLEQGRAVYTPEGVPRSLEGFVTDVTERKIAREQIERSERMFRAIFEDAADGILRIDASGHIAAINRAGSEFLGRPASEIIGQPLDDFLPSEEVARARAYLHGLVTGSSVPETFETVMISPVLGRRTIEVRGRTVRSAEGPVALELVARDITDRRELLRKIAESERLASLGRLSLYVAHEINTPLTSISLLAASIERAETNPDIRAKLAKIHAERRRAAAIISGLLNFSRVQRIEGRETDLRVLVQAAVQHVEPIRPSGVSLFAELGDRPMVGRVDPAQMESVVVNLLKNALEATAYGSVVVRLEEGADHWAVRVADTGTGMSKEVLERIFEPFFTTKRLGHGTGLGLAWSKKIIEGHGGSMEVATKLGEGTTFTVRLPKPTAAKEGAGTPSAPLEASPGVIESALLPLSASLRGS